MLTATIDGRLLIVSGSAAATDSPIGVDLPAGGPARVTDSDGSPVAIAGGGDGVLDLDLTGLAGAGAAVDWTLAGSGGIVARLEGSPQSDRITLTADAAQGSPSGALVLGWGGHDLIVGSLGADDLRGGTGDDTLRGGGGDDQLQGDSGDDVFDGGDGNDTAVFLGGTGVTVDLRIAGAQNTGHGWDSFISIENVTTAWGNDLLIGDAGDNILNAAHGIDTMIGGAGNDTYTVTDPADVVIELAGEGHDTVLAICDWTLGAHVEDLILTGARPLSGTGNDLANLIVGNGAANTLTGGAGDDTLVGGAGADWLIGGIGDDVYDADSADVVIEHDGEGHDRMRGYASLMLAPNIEELELLGDADADGTGNDLDNLMIGNSGANRLDGGGGADTLIGGAGDDVYVYDPLDTIIELPGEGEDELLSDMTVTLQDGLEHLTLTGVGMKDGTGNAAANRIRGNDDDNILDGGGGADTLIGGRGHDTYMVDADDLIIELADGGIDTVISASSYVLPEHVENLTLLGSAYSAIGNAGDNRLEGTDGANFLDGRGGSDTLVGGGGDDIYVVDGSDRIVEEAGGGWDRVEASDSFDLPDHVEELTLTGVRSALLRGNAQANIIRGNVAANVIDGRGGADTLIGGAGDDIYLLHGGEQVVEDEGGGFDTVISEASIVLAPHVEQLLLAGYLPVSGTGNAGDNLISGNAAGNRLEGGPGADTLQGGAGDDVYVVDGFDMVVELAGQGVDVILSSVSIVLPANVEMAGLTGYAPVSATGNDLDNRLVGNAARNVLTGGLGIDTLVGGLGNDIYMVDGLDRVVEAPDEGWDVLIGWGTIKLPANTEEAILRGTLGAALIGNELDNHLTGNNAANLLIGNGGRDRMIGGGGNDLYVADASDIIVEVRGGGWDTVYSEQSFRLPAEVEALNLKGNNGIAGFGNAAANRIVGNAAANWIDGGGGSDTLIGGAGNDIYVADPTDVIAEGRGGGWDTVRTVYNFTLPAQVESLVMLGLARVGVGNDLGNAIYGNDSANVLIGLGGNDTLSGGGGNDRLDGGTGHDRLTGGAGADMFVFGARSDIAVITDFTNGVDRIEIYSGAERYADLSIAAVTGGSSVSFAGTVIYLAGVGRGMIGAEDFVFT